MSEQASTFVEGFSTTDYFEDRTELLLGRQGSFTLGVLARAFPEPILIGQDSVSRIVDNRDDVAMTGFSILASSWGGYAVSWWDSGGVLRTLSAANDVIDSIEPAAVGASTLLVWTVDQVSPLSQLWCNGTLISELAADFAPPAVHSITEIGATAAATENAGQGLGGIGWMGEVLTDDEIVEHFNASLQGAFFADAPFTTVWDARRGLPALNDQTTSWLDELGQVALTRVQTANTMRVASDRPRFR